MPLQPSTWNPHGTSQQTVLYSDPVALYSSPTTGYSDWILSTASYTPIPEIPSTFTSVEVAPSSWEEI
jgi:hypothetical protein